MVASGLRLRRRQHLLTEVASKRHTQPTVAKSAGRFRGVQGSRN